MNDTLTIFERDDNHGDYHSDDDDQNHGDDDDDDDDDNDDDDYDCDINGKILIQNVYLYNSISGHVEKNSDKLSRNITFFAKWSKYLTFKILLRYILSRVCVYD